jgi:Xaa-Pro aminopeptidase
MKVCLNEEKRRKDAHDREAIVAHLREQQGYDATRPLEADMVISIETTMAHPKRGFIKLEDTVAVTEEGCVGFGDQGRGWNRAG